jgi:tripeptidyl-peptidase-1
LYKTDWYTPRAPEKNELGIAGYLEQSVSQADLTKFMTLFLPTAAAAQISIVNVKGGLNNESNPGVEVSSEVTAWAYVTKTCNPTG